MSLVRSLAFPILLAAAILGSLGAVQSADSADRRWDFEDAPLGAVPPWLATPTGAWDIREAPDAPAGPRALFQKGKASGSAFNLAVVADTRYRDLTLSVHLKAVAGEEDQGGGLVWRYRDPGNYYVARYNPLEVNYRVYKVVEGVRRQLGSTRVSLKAGWHRLDVRMAGSRITCDLDGKTYLSVQDETFADAGAVGVWSKADAQTLFDGLEAHALR